MVQDFSSMDALQKDQMACTFAALMLHDEGVEVNSSNISKCCTSAGLKVAAYWPMLFANALSGKNVGDFLQVSGGSGNAPAQAGPIGGNAAPVEKKKKEEEPEEEEEDMDIGDLFG